MQQQTTSYGNVTLPVDAVWAFLEALCRQATPDPLRAIISRLIQDCKVRNAQNLEHVLNVLDENGFKRGPVLCHIAKVLHESSSRIIGNQGEAKPAATSHPQISSHAGDAGPRTGSGGFEGEGGERGRLVNQLCEIQGPRPAPLGSNRVVPHAEWQEKPHNQQTNLRQPNVPRPGGDPGSGHTAGSDPGVSSGSHQNLSQPGQRVAVPANAQPPSTPGADRILTRSMAARNRGLSPTSHAASDGADFVKERLVQICRRRHLKVGASAGELDALIAFMHQTLVRWTRNSWDALVKRSMLRTAFVPPAFEPFVQEDMAVMTRLHLWIEEDEFQKQSHDKMMKPLGSSDSRAKYRFGQKRGAKRSLDESPPRHAGGNEGLMDGEQTRPEDGLRQSLFALRDSGLGGGKEFSGLSDVGDSPEEVGLDTAEGKAREATTVQRRQAQLTREVSLRDLRMFLKDRNVTLPAQLRDRYLRLIETSHFDALGKPISQIAADELLAQQRRLGPEGPKGNRVCDALAGRSGSGTSKGGVSAVDSGGDMQIKKRRRISRPRAKRKADDETTGGEFSSFHSQSRLEVTKSHGDGEYAIH